jgi:hypothetical protein
MAIILLCTGAFAQAPHPKDGYVPDEKTAVRIAVAVLSPIYGEEQIIREQPFHAKLKDGVWIVDGTLPPNMLGGAAEIRIDKNTGAILSHMHWK